MIPIVHNKGLNELLTYLEPKCKPPLTMHVSTWIRKDFEDGKAAVKQQLHDRSSFTLTTDMYTSRATQSLTTTTAHFLDKHLNLTICVLETVHFPGYLSRISCWEFQINNRLHHFNKGELDTEHKRVREQIQ